jgi:hypothetical protein
VPGITGGQDQQRDESSPAMGSLLGVGGLAEAEQVAQVGERLKQVLEAEMASRGLTGFNLDFE